MYPSLALDHNHYMFLVNMIDSSAAAMSDEISALSESTVFR